MRSLGTRVRPGSVMLLVLGVLAVVAALSGPAAAADPAPYPTPAPYDASRPYPGVPPPGSPDRAKGLYLRTCAYCHGFNGEGSQRGPSLQDESAARVDYYLRSGRMPLPNSMNGIPEQALGGKPAFDDADIRALDQYVVSLGGGGNTSIPSVQPGDLRHGREMYTEECASCHAPSGIGYTQVSGLIAPSVLFSSPQVTADAIRSGPLLMPEFPESVFDQSELNDLVTYVQYLQQERVGSQGGASIGRIGAAVEGLVGFAAVVLLAIVARLLGKRSAEKRAS